MITTVPINIEEHRIEISIPPCGPKGSSHQPLAGKQLSTFTK